MNPFKLVRGRRVLVNLKTGDAIFGQVTDYTRTLLYLGDVALVVRDGREPIDGEAIIPADNVSWIQAV